MNNFGPLSYGNGKLNGIIIMVPYFAENSHHSSEERITPVGYYPDNLKTDRINGSGVIEHDGIEAEMNKDVTTKDYVDARLNSYEKNVDNRLDRFEKKIDEYRKETKEEMKAFINEIKADNKSTRTTTIVTAITTVISIVGGIAAFNSSLISNMQQSYGMGKEGAVIQQKVVSLEQRMNSVESKLDKIMSL